MKHNSWSEWIIDLLKQEPMPVARIAQVTKYKGVSARLAELQKRGLVEKSGTRPAVYTLLTSNLQVAKVVVPKAKVEKPKSKKAPKKDHAPVHAPEAPVASNDCVCSEINARHCPDHQDAGAVFWWLVKGPKDAVFAGTPTAYRNKKRAHQVARKMGGVIIQTVQMEG